MKTMLIGALCAALCFLVLAAGQSMSGYGYKPTCKNPVSQIEHPNICRGRLSVN